MSDDEAGGSRPRTGAERFSVDQIMSGLIYLLAQSARGGGCTGVTLAIGQHLELLAVHREAGTAVRATCKRLHGEWMAQLVEAGLAPCADRDRALH
jgi:hypothetical protein